MSTTTYNTTVSSAQVQNVSDTTTTSQPDTSTITQTDPVDHQVNKRLDRVTLLLLLVLLVVAGLRDQVVDRQVAVDMEEDTK